MTKSTTSLFEAFAAEVDAHRRSTRRSCREISTAAGLGPNWLAVALRTRTATIGRADLVLDHIRGFERGQQNALS